MTGTYSGPPLHFAGFPVSAEVEEVDPAALRPYEPTGAWPPSWRGTPAWVELAQSIAATRAVWQPLYALADGTVVDGLARLELARAHRLPRVPVRRVKVPLPLTPEARAAIEEEAVLRALARRQLSADQARELRAHLDELARARLVASDPARRSTPLAGPAPARPGAATPGAAGGGVRPTLTVVPGGRAHGGEAPPRARRADAPPRAEAPAPEHPAQHRVAERLVEQFGAYEDALVEAARAAAPASATVVAALLDAEQELHELVERLTARYLARSRLATTTAPSAAPPAGGGRVARGRA